MQEGKGTVRRGGGGVAVDVVESVEGRAVPDPYLKPVQPSCATSINRIITSSVPDLPTTNIPGCGHVNSDPRIVFII